ncbi:MAG: DUF4437 domain-containing protein [Rhodospirillaceae bacterium]|nr:DUF4437 domain-containing protein [Rhodospirillaceae bacterium]
MLKTILRARTLMAAMVMALPALAFDADAPIVLPRGDQVFEPLNPMIAMAGAWGNRGEGAHGTFGTFEPNFTTPLHTHSGAYHGVVIEGTMTNPFAGEANPPEMEAGSYWYVPANAVHATACVLNTPCRFYFHADKAFDFVTHE